MYYYLCRNRIHTFQFSIDNFLILLYKIVHNP